MNILGTLHALLSLAITLAAVAAAGAALVAAWVWRYERSRFILTVLGAAAALATAVVSATAFAGGAAPGWAAWLRLLPDAMLPALLALLLRDTARRDAAARRAASVSHLNPATGLPNRAALQSLALPALARTIREGASASVVAAALDDLPAIEAARGPGAAREALADFATVLRDTMRAGDVAGHVRPAMLGVLLHGADAEGAAVFAERLRSVAAERLVHPSMDGQRLRVTVGIAIIGEGVPLAALDEAFAAAEAALSTAQGDGGDRVVMAAPPPSRSAGLPQ